jgi:hypothetical protein
MFNVFPKGLVERKTSEVEKNGVGILLAIIQSGFGNIDVRRRGEWVCLSVGEKRLSLVYFLL